MRKQSFSPLFHNSYLAWLLVLGALVAGCTGSIPARPAGPGASPTPLTTTTRQAIDWPTHIASHTLVPTPVATDTPAAVLATAEPAMPALDFPVGRLAILYGDDLGYLYLLTAEGSQQAGSYHAESGGVCPYKVAFSSNGEWLAYVTDRNLVVGLWKEANLTQVVRSIDLSAISPPTQGGWIEPFDLNWVPGSAHLLFTTIEEGGPFPTARLDLYRYDAENDQLKRLLSSEQGGGIFVDPTGKQAALVRDNQIKLFDLTTGKARTVLEYPRILTHTEYYYIPYVDWAPDGSFFQTTVPPKDPVVNPGDPTAIWRVDAATGNAEKLGEIFAGFQARRAYFSPDGLRLAYQYLDTLTASGKIYVSAADGQNARLMLNGRYNLEGWTPSGKYLVVYDLAARQYLGLTLDGIRVFAARQGAFLADKALIYQSLGQQLVSGPRILNDGGQVCAWALLPQGSVDESRVKPFVLPTSTPSPVPTIPSPPTATDKPPATPLPTVTRLPGVGEYHAQIKLQRHIEAVNAVAFQPGTVDTLASAGKDGMIYVWSLPIGDESGKMENPGGAVNGLAWSPDGAILASAGGGGDPAVRLWDGQTGGLMRQLKGAGASFYTVAYAPDGKLLAAAGKDGTIFLWDTANSSQFKILEGHQGAVWGLVFSLDGQTLYSAGSDQSVRAWDVLMGKPSWVEDAGSRVYALALSQDGRWLAAGLEKGGAWLFDLDRMQPEPGIKLETGAVNSLVFHPSYPLLAIGSDHGQVVLYDLNLNQITNRWSAHQGWVLGLAWSADGALLASAGGEGDAQVTIWER